MAYPLPDECKALIAVGLIFPPLDIASQRVKYRINLVELRNIMASELVNDDDVEDDDE